jgi:transcriptional regulator with XRE-family HTH domain
MFDPKQLGGRIRSLRVQKKLSQEGLAELAGLNGKYLGEVERGNANISIANLAKLAEALGASLEGLMSFAHEQDREKILGELHGMLDGADDSRLKTLHRIIHAVIR